MALRRSPSAVPSRLDSTRIRAGGDLVVRDTEWLARQHERFAREWGREWIWKERARDRGAASGNPAAAACLLAALHLKRERTGCEHRLDGEPVAGLLLPPTLIRETTDVLACLDALLRARDLLPEPLVFDAATLLAEMAQNACQHSGEIGCAAATWSARRGEICLAVVDRGIGMAAGLARRGKEGERGGRAASDAALGRRLQLLFAPGGAIESDRGMGLRLSRALVARHHGALHLRSGGFVVTLGPGEVTFFQRCSRRFAAVPGTQICARLRLRQEDARLTYSAESR